MIRVIINRIRATVFEVRSGRLILAQACAKLRVLIYHRVKQLFFLWEFLEDYVHEIDM